MAQVTLNDKTFSPFISAAEIDSAIARTAARINEDYRGQKLLFIAVLNGSFVFAADLLRKITVDCEISFVKVASYHGVSSTGSINELIGLTEQIEGRDVVVIEDIVDTGLTLQKVRTLLSERKPASLRIASLLFKPEAYKGQVPVDYVALEIPNEFIVGYGLDYDGLGRNLPDIYKIVE